MFKLFDNQMLTYFRTMTNIAKNTTISITKTCLPRRYFTVFLLRYMLCKHQTFYFLYYIPIINTYIDASQETMERIEGELIPEVIDTKTNIVLSADSLPEFQSRIISKPRRCISNPITDMNCCTGGRPCGIGQGDCDYDSDCQYGLKCGTDNCYYDFPTSYGFNWEIMADCCYGLC